MGKKSDADYSKRICSCLPLRRGVQWVHRTTVLAIFTTAVILTLLALEMGMNFNSLIQKNEENSAAPAPAPVPGVLAGPSIMKIVSASSFLMNGDTGKIKLPDSVTTVVIDIGARESDYLDVMESLEDESVALILFDPLPDSSIPLAKRVAEYATRKHNDAEGSDNDDDDGAWLDKTKSRQVFLARAAVGEKEGIANFNIAAAPACSSILNTSAENEFWCADAKESIQVAIVTLEGLLPLIPEDSIQQIHVKVDTEGADLAVLRGAGKYIHKVDMFVIECNDDSKHKKFRDGECVKPDAIQYMQDKDFTFASEQPQGDLVNMFFVNSKYKGPLPEFLRHKELEHQAFYADVQ